MFNWGGGGAVGRGAGYAALTLNGQTEPGSHNETTLAEWPGSIHTH